MACVLVDGGKSPRSNEKENQRRDSWTQVADAFGSLQMFSGIAITKDVTFKCTGM